MIGAGMKVRLQLGKREMEALIESLRHDRFSLTADRPEELPNKGDPVELRFENDAEDEVQHARVVEVTPIGEALRIVLAIA